MTGPELFDLQALTDWLNEGGTDPSAPEDLIMWQDVGEAGTVGYDFVVVRSPMGKPSVEAVKWMLMPGVIDTNTLWISDFRGWNLGWNCCWMLREFRNKAGLRAVMNHVEAYLRSQGLYEIDASRPWLFPDQTLRDPFETLEEQGLTMVIPTLRVETFKGMATTVVKDGSPVYGFEQRRNPDGSVSVLASKFWASGSVHNEVAVFRNASGDQWRGSAREYQPFRAGDYAWRDAEKLVSQFEDTWSRMGLDAAENLAEAMAVSNGFCDAERSDPHWFAEGDPDPFISVMELRLAREGRLHDSTVRVEFRLGRTRVAGGKFLPCLEVAKFWEHDRYSSLCVVCTRQTEEEVLSLVEAMEALAESPMHGLRTALERCMAIGQAEGRLRPGNGGQVEMWRIGPDPIFQTQRPSRASHAKFETGTWEI